VRPTPDPLRGRRSYARPMVATARSEPSASSRPDPSRTFSELSSEDVAYAGGKGANLERARA
jgi:hypothetical protein